MAKATLQRLKFSLDSFTSGGFLNDGTYRVVKSRVVSGYDANGNFETPSTGLMLTVIPYNLKKKADGDGDETEVFYAIGDTEFFVATDAKGREVDEGVGVALAPDSTRKGISKKSKFAMFVEAAITAGFPEDDITGDDVSTLDGAVFTMENIVTKKAEASLEEDKPAYDKTFPFPAKYHFMADGADADADADEDEDEKPAKKPAKKPAAGKRGKPAPEPEEDEEETEEEPEEDVEEEAEEEPEEEESGEADPEDAFNEAVGEVLKKTKGAIELAKLRVAIFKLVKAHSESKAITDMVNNKKALAAAVKAAGRKLAADGKSVMAGK